MIESEKYRKLSVTALVTGVVSISIGGLYNFLWLPFTNFMQIYVDNNMMPYIVIPVLGIVFGLVIAAIVCGSIDLKR